MTSQNILLAGSGGGFDIACGILLYLYLRSQGKNVILANLFFTGLAQIGSYEVYPFAYGITTNSKKEDYFSKRHLLEWLHSFYDEASVMYGFVHEVGVAPQ